MPGWINYQLESRLLEEISKDDTTLVAERGEELKRLFMMEQKNDGAVNTWVTF